MWRTLLQRLWANLGTFLLAFAISFAVWISAVVAADPNEERDFPTPLPLEIRGLDPSLLLIGSIPETVTARLSAPSSLWDQLTSSSGGVKAYIDLSALQPGDYVLPIKIESLLKPIRVIQINPQEVSVSLEDRAAREIPITTNIEGQPALGFKIDSVTFNPKVANVVGPADLVAQVAAVQVAIDVADAKESIASSINLQAVDAHGNVLSGLTMDPAQASVTLTILQAGGYRDVAVKVETLGQPASGYRVTNISVSPPVVTLFSTDPKIVASLPGFVGTQALDLSNLSDNVQTRLALDLPAGVIVVGEEQNVEVLIGIAPIESSVLLNVNVEVIGLADGYTVELSPLSVSIVLSGPLSVLQNLSADDVRLFVDVSGLPPGTHLLEPKAEILPTDVRLLSITPSSIEVVITKQ